MLLDLHFPCRAESKYDQRSARPRDDILGRHLSIVKFRAIFSRQSSHRARIHTTKCLLKNSVAFGHDNAAAWGR